MGWVNYFKIADMKKLLQTTDEWMRRRIRMIYWKQWKRIRTNANTRKSYWRISNSPILAKALDNNTIKGLGFLFFSDYYRQVTA
jgi:hypothetical protein